MTADFDVISPYLGLRGRWVPAALHNHTVGSDSDPVPPARAAELARQAGIEVLGLTDHDRRLPELPWTERDWAAAQRVTGILVVRGHEATYPRLGDTREHVNCLAVLPDEVGVPPGVPGFPQAVGQAGGVAWLNHPGLWNCRPEQVLDTPAFDGLIGLEVYSGARLLLEGRTGTRGTLAVSLWDALLTARRRSWALASADCHTWEPGLPDWVANGQTMLRLETLDQPSVLDCLRRGIFYATTGPRIEVLEVTHRTYRVAAPWASEIRFLGAGGELLLAREGPEATYRFTGAERYVRAEVISRERVHADQPLVRHTAWLQPAFIHPRS